MAKPILATPPVTGEDAERIQHEIEHGTPNTPKRIETLRRADEIYQRLMSNNQHNELRDLLELAWSIIANSYGGDWGRASLEWREAAEKWKDRYHATLSDFPNMSETSIPSDTEVIFWPTGVKANENR